MNKREKKRRSAEKRKTVREYKRVQGRVRTDVRVTSLAQPAPQKSVKSASIISTNRPVIQRCIYNRCFNDRIV